MRPVSIVTFERCWLGAWLLGLVNLALSWNSRLAAADMAAAQGSIGATGTTGVLVLGVVIGSAIALSLWYFVARRGSVVAKWIVVVLFALGVLGLLSSVARGTFVGGLGGVLTIVGWLLQAIAVWMLFRPDARAWLGERRA